MPEAKTDIPLADGSRLIVSQQFQNIDTMGYSEYDPDWICTDGSGHVHYRTPSGFPTLETVYEEGGWCGTCRDIHEDREFIAGYLCKACAVTVVPGQIWHGAETITVAGCRDIRREGKILVQDDRTVRELADAGVVRGCVRSRRGYELVIEQYLSPAEAIELLGTVGLPERLRDKTEELKGYFRGPVD